MLRMKRPSLVRVYVSARIKIGTPNPGYLYALAVDVDIPRDLGREGLRRAVDDVVVLLRTEQGKTRQKISGVVVAGCYAGGLNEALWIAGLVHHVDFAGTWHHEGYGKDHSCWVTHRNKQTGQGDEISHLPHGHAAYERLNDSWQ